MAVRAFFDFISSARGENVIEAWLAGLPWQARDEINLQISLLRNVKNLSRPGVGHLQGKECSGLLEIRVAVNGQQYRPLGYYGPEPDQVTMLVGAKEKGGKFVEPRDPCEIAQRRKKEIESKGATVREHKYRS